MEEKTVKFSDLDTIQRCPHDPENPYTMIRNDLIRDCKLSPECRWLIIYLLSNTNNWRITISQIVSHLDGMIGRRKVYGLIQEAINSGYMKREDVFSGNLKNHMRYFVSETPKFNQNVDNSRIQQINQSNDNSPCDHFRHAENGHSQEEHKKEITIPSKTSLMVSCFDEKEEEVASSLPPKVGDIPCADETPKRSRKHAEFTTQVKTLTAEMIASILKHEPEYKPPTNLAAFMTEVDYMLRLDKRDPDKMLEVLNWALADHFWKDKMFKPNSAKYLREKYLQLKNQMESPGPKKERKFAACSDDKQAYETLKEMDKRAL